MFKPEQIIGRHYKILSRLGAGGMGQVYKALDVNLGREVAIKFLLAEMAKEEEIVKRFLNEGRVLATINHPAVINVYASDVEEGGIPFLVMEFVDGKSLGCHKDALKADPISLVNQFIQLFSGIHSCHQRGIIHRDLKPENVLINKEGQLKIVDFGIAKTATRHTRTGMAIGTPHYMSPEQCLGKADITAKTDVYAGGVMLFEMLTGKLPFNIEGQADDPALAIALMHLNDTPDFSSFAQVNQGDSFKALVTSMLSKKPDERPEIPDILESLKQILNRLRVAEGSTDPTSATTPTIGEIYQIQQELGAGGMGKVYKALDTSLNRIVAIKVLHDTTSGDSPLVERFIREGQTLATVGHRNVMGIYASGRDKVTGRPFLVMEHIAGKPLTQLKQAINKDSRQAVPIMLQLAEGIAACHERNIIHRDLKPANIIITPTGLVKILDFGIAKTQSSLTKTGMTVGTPEYMSPEQCTGSRNLSGKSDIYSLGIIFWELIFGMVPFKADGPQNPELSIAIKHIEATLPVQVAIPDMSMVPIISLVRRMLDKDPAARPAEADIIDTLECWLIEHAPESMPHSTTGRRSTSRSGVSSLSGLVKAAGQQPASSKKYVIPAVLAALLGIGGLAIRYGTGGDKSGETRANEINELIASHNFVEARRKFDDFAASDEGRKHAPEIRKKLIQALIASAETAESNKDFATAIKLFGQAIALDPTNPKAALTLSRLQQEKEKHDRLRNRIESLNQQALALIDKLEPASGTHALEAVMKELDSLDLASVSADIGAAWKARFINLGELTLASNPQKSLAYYQDLQKYFPETEGLTALIEDAEKRAKAQEEELAQATMLSTLKTALNTAIDNYVPGQKPDLICQQIIKVQELGDAETADALSRKLGEKIAGEADNWIVSNPAKAIDLFNTAKLACPVLPGLDTKLKLAEESLASMRSSEELKKERDDLSAALAVEIKAINPPAPVEDILQQFARLATYADSASLVDKHREALYQKYFAKTSDLIEKAPIEALATLRVCIQIKPDAPGLDEVKSQIEMRIEQEEHRRAAEEKRERLERLAKKINDIYTRIKKSDIPEDVPRLRQSITDMLREFADSGAANKLEQHLIDRCNEELKKLENSAPDKAVTLAEQLKAEFTDNTAYQTELSDLLSRLAEKARLAATQRAVNTHAANIRKFAESPQSAGVAETLELFEEIKKLDASYDTAALLREASDKIRGQAQQATSASEAERILKVLQSFDKNSSINLKQEMAKLADKNLASAESLIRNFKPGKDISPIINALTEFDNWNEKEKKGSLISQSRASYVKAINETSEKSAEESLLLLRQLYKLPGLSSDAQLKALEQTLIKLDSEQKTPKVDPRVEQYANQAEQLISGNQVLQQSANLVTLLSNLEALGEKSRAASLRAAAATKALAEAEKILAQKDFDNALKATNIARQLHPANQQAAQLTTRISEARNKAQADAEAAAKAAALAANELTVGAQGNYKTIADALKAAKDGSTIKVQAGSYNETLILSGNVNIQGEAAARCVVNSSRGPTLTLSGRGKISGLTLTNNSGSTAPTVLVKSGDTEVSGCIISNATSAKAPNWVAAIEVSGGNPTISSNTINGSKAMGITVSGGSPTIAGNNVSGCAIYGMWFSGFTRARVSENTITQNGKSGVGIKDRAAPDFTRNTIVSNHENGMLIYQNGTGSIDGNIFRDNAMAGIEVWDAQPAISNNVIESNRKNGITVRGRKANVKLRQNSFKGNSGQEISNAGGTINNF